MARKAEIRWPLAHHRLKAIYDERADLSRITMAEFGRKFGLGSSGMVWQYLTGYSPLNYDAAARFAKGLNCRIEDFCPEMAEELADKILPQLNASTLKRAVKAAMAALVLALVMPQSEDAQAAAPVDSEILHNVFPRVIHICARLWARLLQVGLLALQP